MKIHTFEIETTVGQVVADSHQAQVLDNHQLEEPHSEDNLVEEDHMAACQDILIEVGMVGLVEDNQDNDHAVDNHPYTVEDQLVAVVAELDFLDAVAVAA